MNYKVKRTLAENIELAEKVSKVANEARYCKQDCIQLKSKTDNLAMLLRQVATECSDLYECNILQINKELLMILREGLSLVLKCRSRANILSRLFTKIPVPTFRVVSSNLDDFISDVSWLLHSHDRFLGVPSIFENSGFVHCKEYLCIPPIVAEEPALCSIWEKITVLYTGSLKGRYDAAASLIISSCKSYHWELIIKERWFSLLLMLLNTGKMEEQEIATRVIGLLGRFPESVEHLIQLGVCSLFAKILEEGPITVQTAVAWAVSELARNYPKCQDHFAQHNIINLLVDHLAFAKVEEHSKYAVVSMKPTSITSSGSIHGTGPWHEVLKMKEMAARALRYLAKGNSPICRIIVEFGALLYLVVLLETELEDVQYKSAMAVMEITAVAEKDVALREYAFHSNSRGWKAIVDQLLRIIEEANSACLIPCLKTIGNLARTFNTATTIIRLLLRLLRKSDSDKQTWLTMEVLDTLIRFACTENDLHMDHSKAIISAGGVKSLIELLNSGDQMVHTPALVLLSYIVLHVPHNKELAEADVLGVLEWVSKQSTITQDELAEELLIESKSRLELYQSRDPRIP